MMSKRIDRLDFNKQILVGEIGSLVGIQLTTFFGYRAGENPGVLSWMITAGSIFGAVIFFLVLRFLHEKRKGRLSSRKFIRDLFFYTPFATISLFFVYLPTLKFFSFFLLSKHYVVWLSSLLSQAGAFILFLLVMNIYLSFLREKVKVVL